MYFLYFKDILNGHPEQKNTCNNLAKQICEKVFVKQRFQQTKARVPYKRKHNYV